MVVKTPKPLRHIKEFIAWVKSGFAMPSPNLVKRNVLKRNSLRQVDFVETGTYLGETTKFLRSAGYAVITIEVQEQLFDRAKSLFAKDSKVTVLKGDSGQLIKQILIQKNDSLNFWLDGHYSGGFTGKGAADTPVKLELESIGEFYSVNKHLDFMVAVDDVRCFNPNLPEYSDYPPASFLVDWAEQLGAAWHIEHDIFFARRSTALTQ